MKQKQLTEDQQLVVSRLGKKAWNELHSLRHHELKQYGHLVKSVDLVTVADQLFRSGSAHHIVNLIIERTCRSLKEDLIKREKYGERRGRQSQWWDEKRCSDLLNYVYGSGSTWDSAVAAFKAQYRDELSDMRKSETALTAFVRNKLAYLKRKERRPHNKT